MRLGQSLHPLKSLLIEDKRESKGLGDRRIGDIIVPQIPSAESEEGQPYCNFLRGANASASGLSSSVPMPPSQRATNRARAEHVIPSDNKVVAVAHPAHGFDDLILVV